jgi:Ca2+-binding RTX toxin-like protein
VVAGPDLLETDIDFGNAQKVGIAATTERDAHVLRVAGTSEADSIQIAEDNGVFTVTVNGVTQQRALAGIERLEVLDRQGNDVITRSGLTRAAVVRAGADADTVDASGITTTGVTLLGNSGADTLIGGARADLLNGGSSNDVLTGKAGKDPLIGGRDGETFRGGSGAGTIVDPEKPRSASTASAGHLTIRWDAEPVEVATVRPGIDWEKTYFGAGALSSGTPSARSSKTASA